MSLSKQLLILISALFLIIFCVNFILSVNNIKGYLQGEAEVHAQDTATSLGLSLSPYMEDEADPVIETTMRAIFDMGYYQEIRLVNLENETLVLLTNEKNFEDVPGWFVELIPMKTSTAESEISSDWNITGVVFVTINPGYAYYKLYEQVRSSFYYSLATFVIAIVLLLVVLRLTLSPLKKIDQLALTIAAGRFETIDETPWTTEIKNVTTSINVMSKKIGDVVSSLNTRLDTIGQKLQLDELTGLKKKSRFETDMKQLFASDSEALILMIKIDGLNQLVKELEDGAIDQFIKDFAKVLIKVADQNDEEISVYRFVGSEFVLLIHDMSLQQVEQIGQQLSACFTVLGEQYQKPDIAHTGVIVFNPTNTIEGNLFAASEAYEQARLIGENSFFVREGEDQAKDISQWKDLVFNMIDNQFYKVNFVGRVQSFNSEELLMEEAFSKVTGLDGEAVATGTFVSIAEKFSKIVDLDKGVLSRVIKFINDRNIDHAIAINLSTRTIKSSDFRAWLVKLLKQNEGIAQQLVFSFSAYAVAKEIPVYKEFIDFVQNVDARVMIKRFDAHSLSPEEIENLNPNFIRLARNLGDGIASDESKQAFVQTIQEVGALLDIQVLAENIMAEDDFECVKGIGIAGASR